MLYAYHSTTRCSSLVAAAPYAAHGGRRPTAGVLSVLTLPLPRCCCRRTLNAEGPSATAQPPQTHITSYI
jgi:hypothetical protein